MKRKRYHGLILILFLTFLLVHANSQNTDLKEDHEKAILLNVKSYLRNSSYLLQWWNLTSSPCNWPGISCSRGFVTGIDLNGGEITEIPPFICKLKNLKLLRFTYNSLLGLFPTALYNCSKLEVLDLSNNLFRGPLPTSIHRLSRLTTLNLGGNLFSGLFPAALYNCSMLEVLDLSGNVLLGPLPTNIHGMFRLTTLNLAANNFSGLFPTVLYNCSKLEVLDLSYNQFNGTIPGAVGQLLELKNIYLGSNNFEGSLPREIGNLSNLVRLDVSDMEKFELATIPDELDQLMNLKFLMLSKSNLTGNIPETLSNLSSLERMDLSRNYLNGSIPGWLFHLRNLREVSLDHNQLYGGLPSSLGESKISFLDVSWNKLSGMIPSEFDKYSSGFIGNFDLCTNNSSQTSFHLCTSNSSNATNHIHHRARINIVIVIIVIGVLVIVVLLCVWYYILKHSILSLSKHSWLKSQEINDGWKFIPFRRTNLTQSEIVLNLTEENLIGSGGSGCVYRIAVSENSSHVAVKRIWNETELDIRLEKQFFAELQTLSGIRHVNIVTLICCISNQKSKLLVYEYLENQSLDKWLHPKKSHDQSSASQAPNVVLNWDTRLRIAIGAASGLCYMHHDCSPPIIHRDIKSSNILLDNELNAKVADFGLAKVLGKHGHTETASAIAGTFGYIAPEYAYTSKISMKSDVYSFGVVLLELVTGRKAVSRDDHMNLAQWSWEHMEEDKPIEDALDEAIKEPTNVKAMMGMFKLGLMCTNKVASIRPSMKEVVQALVHLSSY